MRKIETVVTVVDGKITIPVPPDLPPGEHNVLVVIDEAPSVNGEKVLGDFPVIQAGSWPAELSLRREDMYGEWGR